MPFQKKYIPLLLGVAVAFGIFIGANLNFTASGDVLLSSNSNKEKLNRLIDFIDFEYVDQVNTDSIVDSTVNSILENLDPHSVYISSKDYEQTASDMRGNFTGIGISFYQYQDSIAVIRTIDGGPAQKAGILPSDRILFADTTQLYGKNLSRYDIFSNLKGARNTKVTLTIKRKNIDSLLSIAVIREKIPLHSLDAAYLLTDTVGYIKLNRFAEPTYNEFKKALTDLTNQGATKLVLDLRDNPGGYISSAQEVVDEFLEDNTLILITKNKNGTQEKTYATQKGGFKTGGLYVLINENSASASEIVAGALQDNDKGVIVGRRSFGKGLVQREMALGDGSAVRLTTARYYTPTGRSIQRPYDNGSQAYYNEYESRYVNGELQNKDSIVVNDSLRFVTPKGKVVYGGGGIIPDVFVGKDTSQENQAISYMSKGGFMSYFVFEYLDAHRQDFKGQTQEDFIANYTISQEIMQAFFSYANTTSDSFKGYTSRLKLVIKATLARQLFGSQAYQMILNSQDPMVKKVLELQ